MQLYKATVRIKPPGSTSPTHELEKEDLTAPEIVVLRHVHGDDAVLRISKTKMDKREKAGEVERLRDKFNSDTRDVIREVFGPAPLQTMPLALEVEAEEVKA
jgi:hypothetical protein